MSNLIDLTGQKFERLTVIGRGTNSPSGAIRWRCLCSCGVETLVHTCSLKQGTTKSCGCFTKDRMRSQNGFSGTPEYVSWLGMFTRCRDTRSVGYKHYGGRGITICERWEEFDNFLFDMGHKPSSKHSIDRIDVDGDYSPENCRWATQTEQHNNKRNNRLLTVDGKTQSISMWASEVGVSRATLFSRLHLGWPLDVSLLQPLKPRGVKGTLFLTINGISKSVSAWAMESGVSYPTLRGRFYMGWPQDESILKPSKTKESWSHHD